MDIFLPCDLADPSIGQELPSGSKIKIEKSDSAEVIELPEEGLGFFTLVSAVLGGSLATFSFLGVCFCFVLLFTAAFELHHCLFLFVIFIGLTAWGVQIVKQNVQLAFHKTKFTISDGMLSIEQHGPMASEVHRIWINEIVETGVWPEDRCGESFPSFTGGNMLWIRMPTVDFKPFSKFIENKDCRRHTLLSYPIFVAKRRRSEELRFLERWIDINIAVAKSEPQQV